MATKVQNEKGFLVIKMSLNEAINTCGFGYNHGGEAYLLDGNTNDMIDGDVYYVAVLNEVFGEESYNEWYDSATFYKEDIPYEKEHFNYYSNKLNLKS